MLIRLHQHWYDIHVFIHTMTIHCVDEVPLSCVLQLEEALEWLMMQQTPTSKLPGYFQKWFSDVESMGNVVANGRRNMKKPPAWSFKTSC